MRIRRHESIPASHAETLSLFSAILGEGEEGRLSFCRLVSRGRADSYKKRRRSLSQSASKRPLKFAGISAQLFCVSARRPSRLGVVRILPPSVRLASASDLAQARRSRPMSPSFLRRCPLPLREGVMLLYKEAILRQDFVI